jgi:methyltransferase (TIGR00027 family)
VDAYQPSRTALGAALHRAAHQVLDSPLVFADPLALRIVGEAAEQALRDGRDPRVAQAALRAFIAVRSRVAEDCLAGAYRRGVRQYVLLGAGLDTFGCRNDQVDLRVFEVDRPASQGRKRALLASIGVTVPGSLTFAAVDFEREIPTDGLARAGFDLAAPAQFAMLGVSMYLTAGAVTGAASFVAGLPPGTEIVFDYATPKESLDAVQRAAADALGHRVAAAGEPFSAAFAPDGMHELLAGLGFTRIEDFGTSELNARYFAGRDDGLALRGGAHIAVTGV